MTTHRFRAFDKQGRPYLGEVQATNWQAVVEHLEREGFHNIEPGQADDKRWQSRQDWARLRRDLDLVLLGKFVAALGLLVLLVAGGLFYSTRRTLVAEGRYAVNGRARTGLSLCFFLDGKAVFPKAKDSQIGRDSYRCQLTYHSWHPPERIQVRLRMRGYKQVTHQSIPLPKPDGKPVLAQLPTLTLQRDRVR